MIFKKPYSIIFILLIMGLIFVSVILSLFTPFSIPYPISLIFSPYVLFALIATYFFVYLTRKMDQILIRRFFVFAFFIYSFLPFGGYMFEGTTKGGLLVPIMFPFGWASIAFGIFLLFYPKLSQIKKKISLSNILVVSGISIYALQFLFPYKEFLYFLNPAMLQFTVEVEGGFLYGLDILGLIFAIAYPFFCLFAGILLHFKDK